MERLFLMLSFFGLLNVANPVFAMFRGSRVPTAATTQLSSFNKVKSVFDPSLRPSCPTRLENTRTQKFRLPVLPAHKIDTQEIKKHEDLCIKWDQHNEANKDLKKAMKKSLHWSLGAFVVIPASIIAFNKGIIPTDLAYTSVALAQAINGGNALFNVACKLLLRRNERNQAQTQIQIMDIINNQKQELKLCDDIQ